MISGCLLRSGRPALAGPSEAEARRWRRLAAPLWRRLDRIPVRYHAMLLLARFASLRFGELAALRRGDIDLERCDYAVPDQHQRSSSWRWSCE